MDEVALHIARLPLVVQVGFAGSRRLLDAHVNTGVDTRQFDLQVQNWLAARLIDLRKDLRLADHHFFCGISALAIGADIAFSRACMTSTIPQRIFLPQTRDEFLNAEGKSGTDFPLQSQKDEVLQLLRSPHVIQERLVSNSAIRDERFDDTNREIVRVSDVLMCLVRSGSMGRPGGTEELISRAVQRGKPVLVINVDIADGKPIFTERWQLPEVKGARPANPADAFEPPTVPTTLCNVQTADDKPATTINDYATLVKDVASPTAKRMQANFKTMAKVIIAAHIIATILAAMALGFAWLHAAAVIEMLLALELTMLGIGMVAHQWLHRTRVSHVWAEARLLAEVTRSVMAIGNLHLYLQHLFTLPFPKSIRPLLRTINVLHLQSTKQDKSPWQTKRDEYIERRLRMPKNGQIDFYGRRARESGSRLQRLHKAFFAFWIIAFVSTCLKLILHRYMEDHPDRAALLTGIMGTLAIVMPVLAAGALSMAAALDLEAQEHTYEEMGEFLERQERNLRNATSERDYADLVLETETHLLGETANWFSRRSFVTVA